MGCADVCPDNAMAVSFVIALKNELYCRRVWPAKKRSCTDVAKWIADSHDRRRRHASLVQASPVALEMRYVTNTTARKKVA
jgi:hypothetical protein